jgi:hypothetical protein
MRTFGLRRADAGLGGERPNRTTLQLRDCTKVGRIEIVSPAIAISVNNAHG